MIELTVLEQRRASYWRRRDHERPSPRYLLRESDELMFWLEECLVQGLGIVPGWVMPRLLNGERRPAALMEILYQAQERLMEQSVNSRLPARIVPLFRQGSRRSAN